MFKQKKLCLGLFFLVLLFIMIGCGSSSDSPESGVSITTVERAVPVDGTLEVGDTVDSGGFYNDFYQFTVTGADTYVTITMESGDVDCYLYLYSDDVAGVGDLSEWVDHKLYENDQQAEDPVSDPYDDPSLSEDDSKMTITLPAGTYIIRASTYESATTGGYTLTFTYNT